VIAIKILVAFFEFMNTRTHKWPLSAAPFPFRETDEASEFTVNSWCEPMFNKPGNRNATQMLTITSGWFFYLSASGNNSSTITYQYRRADLSGAAGQPTNTWPMKRT
jgi:hypothetical protein